MGRKQTVNIAYLGSLIRQWDNNRDITHAMQIRLIKLLLGTDVNLLMDAQGKYPASNFNMIALAILKSFEAIPKYTMTASTSC